MIDETQWPKDVHLYVIIDQKLKQQPKSNERKHSKYLSLHCAKLHVVLTKKQKKEKKNQRPADYVITGALLTADNLFLGFLSNYLEIYC